MNFIIRKPWHLKQSQHTPIQVFKNRQHHRRDVLRSMGISLAGLGIGGSIVGCGRPSEEEVAQAGKVKSLSPEVSGVYPAIRNPKFEYGRAETSQRDAREFCNFYEFSERKEVWRYISDFQSTPWSVEIAGLCSNPKTYDLDDIYKLFQFEERAYRHRCIETWAMCVPWTGFPLRHLLKQVEPKPSATYVTFETVNRPSEAANMRSNPSYPWPYQEGLTLEEANNELTFLATGVYGDQLLKQNGPPIRLVVPWKYGFKCIKSIVKITLTDIQPQTFWNTMFPDEYGFTANVDPTVAHPRWSQRTEWMLGNHERHETVIYNGYGEYVGNLYS